MNNQALLNKASYIYFVGIKGVGMTALAQILQSRGKKVSGSDTQEKFFTDAVLKKLKITYKEGFKAKNIPAKTDLVIYSTAFNLKTHPELLAARKKKIPILSYPIALSSLFNNELGIAISGTHGKTTTSALVAESLENIGLDPTALIGSRVTNWRTNAVTGQSPFFVIEADEHQNKLRHYRPWSLILTNIDYDHPDYYRNPENYFKAFKNWVGKWQTKKSPVPKIGVINGDDAKIKRLIRELKLKNTENLILLTYGKNAKSNILIRKQEVRSKKQSINTISIEISLPGIPKNEIVKVKTNLIGEHNAYNLAAAFAFIAGLNLAIGKISQGKNMLKPVPLNTIAKSLALFGGTERRMQLIGKRGRVLVYDDYAHHPQEIKATLSALKNHFAHHEVFVIFQSHTFTRTRAFLKDFVGSLKIADVVGLLPIYGSAREFQGNISSAVLADKLTKRNTIAHNFLSHDACLRFLKQYKFKKPTILITMGAGDGWRIGRSFLKF